MLNNIFKILENNLQEYKTYMKNIHFVLWRKWSYKDKTCVVFYYYKNVNPCQCAYIKDKWLQIQNIRIDFTLQKLLILCTFNFKETNNKPTMISAKPHEILIECN